MELALIAWLELEEKKVTGDPPRIASALIDGKPAERERQRLPKCPTMDVRA